MAFSFTDFISNNWQDLAKTGLNAYSAYTAAQAQEQAAADAALAAQAASQAASFKPYSVTTGLGTGYFNPETQTAGYTLDPALQAYRDQMMQMSAQALPTSMDTQANADKYYAEMQGMMAPARQAENLQMQQDLFGSGRLGLRLAGAGAGAGTGMVQPDVFGLNQSRALADQALAQQSRQQAQNELDAAIARGTGLFQTAVGTEQLGLTPLELGGTFGGYASNAGAQQATNLLKGGLAAAQSNLNAGMMNAGLLSGAANTLGTLKFN